MEYNNSQIDINDLQHAKSLGFNPTRWFPCPRGKDGKINPQVTQMSIGDNQFISVFHVRPVYYETLTGDWRPLSEVTYGHGNRFITFTPEGFRKVHPQYVAWLMKRASLINGSVGIYYGATSFGLQPHQMVYATDTTKYPDPHPESTSVDGWTAYEAVASWATVCGSATGNNTNDSNASTFIASQNNGGNRNCGRNISLFDTSSITDTDSVDSAVLSIKRNDTIVSYQNANSTSFVPVSSSPASNTAVVDADFDQVGSTEFASRINFSSTSNGAYSNFTLNASGLANITLTGVSKFAFRTALDLDLSDPTGLNRISFHAGNSSTTNDPKLVVTHSAGGGGGFAFSQSVVIM